MLSTFRGWSLRARLMALLLATLMPLMGLGAYWVVSEARQKRVEAEDQHREIARRVARDAAHLVRAVHEMLAVLARLPAVRTGDRRASEPLFRELLAASPHLENIGLVGADGTVAASAVPLPEGGPVSASERDWFQRVLRSGQPVVGGFHIGRITGKPVANLAHPVTDGAGRLTAVVFADLRLAAVSQQVDPAQTEVPLPWVVVDGRGLVLLHSDRGQEVGKPLVPLSGMLRAEAAVPGSDWRTILGIPDAVIAARVRQELLAIGLPVLMILLLTTTLGFVIARDTWLPLQRLATAVRRIGAGEPSIRIPVEAGGEVGEVTTAFARTLNTLAAQQVELHRRNGELSALLKANQAIASSLDLEQILTAIVTAAADLTGASLASLLLVEDGRLVWKGRAGPLQEAFKQETGLAPIPIGESFSGEVAARGQVLWVPDMAGDPRQAWGDFNARYDLRCYLGVPILAGERVLGVLHVISPADSGLGADRRDLLEPLAAQAAVAIANARLHEVAVRRAQQLATLNDLTRMLTTTLDPQAVARAILAAANTLIPGAAGRFWERVAEEDAFRLVASVGMREPEGGLTLRFHLGEGLTGIAAAIRQPVISQDVTQDPRFVNKAWAAAEGLVSTIVVPLVHGDRVTGSLAIFTRVRHAFTQEEVDLLRSFATQAAIAMENVRLYEQIRQHAATLERRVQERTAELEVALRVKSQLLANMSHEFRTPLNFILGFAQLLQERTAGPLTPKQAQHVDRIQKGGKWLLELVNNILELSMIDTGKARLQLEPVPLAPLVQDVLDIFSVQVQQKGLTVTTSLDPGLPVVVADRGKLTQILANLVGNAVKFTPDGDRITVAARLFDDEKRRAGETEHRGEGELSSPVPGFPESPIQRKEKWVEIAVADTGIGIKPEDLEQIFVPFHQVDASDTRHYGGAGLGLSLARHLVELHGGRVWAESAGLGQGARFVVRLPLLEVSRQKRMPVVEDEAGV